MPSGFIADRGQRGLEFVDKRLVFRGASWYEPTGSVILYDDFLGQVMNPDIWDAVQVQATSGTAWATLLTAGGADAGHGGWVAGVTGTGDDDCEMIVGSRNFTTLNAINGKKLVFETRLVAPVITTVCINAGFTDAITESAAGAIVNVTSGDAVTGIPDDTISWVYDTDQTTDTFRGVAALATAYTSFAASVNATAPPTDDPFVLRIEADTTGAYFYMSRVPTGYSAGDGVGPLDYFGGVSVLPAGTTALAPYLAVTARGGTDNLALESDYMFVAGPRSIK